MLEDILIDFESNLSMFAKPYPETSKSLNIKSLSTRQIQEWNCLFVLNNYAETNNCRLRISLPPNESCPFEEEITIYSQSFGIKMLDLLAPDILQTYTFSVVKFHQYFVNLPFHTAKICLTKISPEKMVFIIKNKQTLEISSTIGVISKFEDSFSSDTYFCINLS